MRQRVGKLIVHVQGRLGYSTKCRNVGWSPEMEGMGANLPPGKMVGE